METGELKPVTRGPYSAGRVPCGQEGRPGRGPRDTQGKEYCRHGYQVHWFGGCGAVVWDPWGRGRAKAWGGGGMAPSPTPIPTALSWGKGDEWTWSIEWEKPSDSQHQPDKVAAGH